MQVQRFPDGSFGLAETGRSTFVENMTARGHVFVAEYPDESQANTVAKANAVEGKNLLEFQQTVKLVNYVMFALAKPLFEHPMVEYAGMMQFDLGFLNAFEKQMWSNETGRLGRPFPDKEFRAQVVFPVEALVRQNIANEQQLFHQIRHGFDLCESGPRSLPS